MKRKFWNWVKNEGDSGISRTLFLNGEISDETWYGDEVTPQIFKDELYADSGDITVWINSPAITVMELNETDTELWKRAVKSFGGATLASEIQTLSKFILKVA